MLNKHLISLTVSVYIFIAIPHGHAAETGNNFLLGYKAYQEGGFEKAVELLEAATKDDTILSDYSLYYLGESYLAINRIGEALNAFQSCINYNPKSPFKSSAMEKIGDIYLATADASGAINTYKEILAGYSDNIQTPRILYKIVSILLQGNKYDEALPFIKRLLTEFPQMEYNDDSFASQVLSGETVKLSMDEFSTRAKGLLKARSYEKAIGEIRTYLSEAPSWFPYDAPLKRNDKLNLLLGQTFYQARNYKKAGDIFKESFSSSDDGRITQESLIWLARNYIRQKDTKSAKNALKTFTSVYTDRNLRDEAIYRLAMIAKDEGNPDKAADLLKQLIAENPSSSYKDEALWQIGWIDYSKGNLGKALETLKSLENSSLKMRALYWQGKISIMLGKKDNAARLFKMAANSIPADYYSVMSKRELGKISGYELQSVNFKVFNIQPEIGNHRPDKTVSVKRTRRLLELGLNDLALKELASIDYKQELMNIILLYQQAGDIYHSYILAKSVSYDSQDFAYRFVYPEAYKELVEKTAGELGLDSFLIYAVMMQESEFNAMSVSSAGAIGLLQIMPGTGEMIAKKLSRRSFQQDSLFEPAVNINFGGWYLKTLITRFNGILPLAVAAYNAGPTAVDEWLKKWSKAEMDEFVENIPYQETRQYVKRVLGHYDAYKTIYAQREADIGRRLAENEE